MFHFYLLVALGIAGAMSWSQTCAISKSSTGEKRRKTGTCGVNSCRRLRLTLGPLATPVRTAALVSVSWAAEQKPYFSLEEADKHFEEFIEKYDRQYANEAEKNIKFEIFKQNLVKINKQNMNPNEDAWFGINQFADWTQDEFKRYLGPDVECKLLSDSNVLEVEPVHQCKIQAHIEDTSADIPDSLDWREKNAVTTVKTQGCGDCWSFGTTGNVESMYAIKYGELVNFSEQQLTDCDKNNDGCEGGTFNASFGGLVTIGGMMKLDDYPYKGGKRSSCKFDKSKVVAKLKDCIVYDLKDEEQLRSYVATNGPVAISLSANSLNIYDGGIFKYCPPEPLNHAVLLVGYGTENGTHYWIIKNSWGKSWGENGYMRLLRNVNACGIVNPCAATAVIE